MKKLYFLLYSSFSVFGFSQTILNQSESTARTVQDPTVVVLAPGFHATSAVSNPFVAKIGASTDTSGGGPNTPSTAGSTNPSGTTETTTNRFHDTQGNIEVNGGGQLQFTLPIALPPGVKSVAPQVNLVYTSGSGNGIAGYGWNISGITAISRMGKTIEKDGEVKGIQLDYSDYYSFNGQRLILKSGEYGKDGAEYITEKFSNIKIKSVGRATNILQPLDAPQYFEVTFEDGSQAWYGALETTSPLDTPARTLVEFNIVKWRDAQGNYIIYNYTQSGNVAVISSILWGGNETLNKPNFNEITFEYNTDSFREFKEISYVKGHKFVQERLLSNIITKSNGSIFKKYKISYDFNSDNKYQFVKSIQEENSVGDKANPIVFNYENPPIDNWKQSKIKDSNNDNAGLNGDFDGDGNLDLIKVEGSNLFLYKNVFATTNPTKISIGSLPNVSIYNFKSATTFTIKTSDNKILGKQGFVTFLGANGVSYDKQNLIVRGYSINASNQIILEFEKTVLGEKYDYSEEVYDEDLPLPVEYSVTRIKTGVELGREFDLDSNGLSEIVLKLNDNVCYDGVRLEYNPYNPTYPPFPTPYSTCYNWKRYIVLEPYIDQDINEKVGEISSSKDFFSTTKGDFNGDGILDFISNDSYISTFHNDTYGFNTTEIYHPNGTFTGLLDYAVAGDFNGDGKTDLMLPNADKQSDWTLHISKGNNNFEKEQKAGHSYFSKEVEISDQGTHNGTLVLAGCQYFTQTYYQYISDDLDGDGKFEFIANKIVLKNHQWNAHYDKEDTRLYSDIYTTTKTNNSNVIFSKQGQTSEFYFDNVVVPFSVTSMYKNGKKTIILGKPENCGKTDCESFIFLEANQFKDIGKYARINYIKQGEIVTNVEYKELDPSKNPNLYAGSNNVQFPYVELDKVSQSYAVSGLTQAGRKQDFRYRGLITHLQGKGMIGFRQTARSSWYTDDLINTKIWSGAEIDPLKDGVPIKEWSIKTNNESQIFPTDISENNSQLLSFKSTEYRFDKLLKGNLVDFNTVSPADKAKVVSAIIPIKSITKDFMKDVRSESTITYDGVTVGGGSVDIYYLPTKTESIINNDFSVSTTNITYVNNASGVGKDYYIGRPSVKREQMTVYGDTKGSKEEYAYENNLLTTLKTWNRDNTGWLNEEYTYDGFGNVTQKIISNSKDANTQISKATYEDKGRFVIRKTDNLNLETNITYNNWGQVETQTDPLGNILTNTYDSWGKILTSKSNLGGTTTYTYEKASNKDAIVSEYSPDGNRKISFTNYLGQNYKSTTKKFGQGQYVSATTVYDGLGRKIATSEPYSGSYPTQWNTIEYDEYSRPIKAISFTGKVVESSYTGRTATVTETNANNRFKKQTADPIGNIITSEDLGGIINFKFNAAGENIEANYEGNIVKTSYDAWGNKVRFEDPSNGVYEYEYNGYMGTISKTKSPKGEKIYEYNNLGQLKIQKEKSTTGNATDKVINFAYNDKGLITQKYGTASGKSFSSGITYDSFGRVLSSYEDSNGKYFMKRGITYDSMMRVTSYEKSLYSSGILTKVALENVYDTWNGELSKVKEKGTGKILWELNEVNEKGQVTKARLGGVNIDNTYLSDGFLDYINHKSIATDDTILYIDYTFDAIKNELKKRYTGGLEITEFFDYDSNNRLINWTDPVTNIKPTLDRNIYDNKGRITSNDQIGTIGFGNNLKKYQATSMVLNAQGTENYTNDLLQKITYNENNDPLFIDGVKGDVSFEYGLTSMRQRVSYGGNFEEGTDGKFTKYYSEDGSYEVIRNNQTGQEKHLIYIGGSPYESNIIYLKEFNTSTPKFVFLHKDYLGSVLAITDEAGTKLEQRHFDAWGNLTHLKIGAQAIITDKTQIRDYLSAGNLIVDRGYTSHEHFAEVGLIHMNGRLYDPLLRRFLNADENIQDPHNTQNYNRYGYVMNNPLLYNDPSGEFLFIPLMVASWIVANAAVIGTAALIGAAIGAGMYLAQAFITGNFTWGGFGKSILMGAVTGAVSGGLGQVFSTAGFWGAVGNGALTGAGSGGITSIINGTNFFEGLIKGAVIGGVVGGVSYTIKYYANGNNKTKYTTTKDIDAAGGNEAVDNQTMNDNLAKAQSARENQVPGLARKSINSEGISITDSGYLTVDGNTNVLGSSTPTNFWSGKSDILYSTKAASDYAVLGRVMSHESAHAYRFALGLPTSNIDELRRYDNLLDSVEHLSIRTLEYNSASINNIPLTNFKSGGYVDSESIRMTVNSLFSYQKNLYNMLLKKFTPIFNIKY